MSAAAGVGRSGLTWLPGSENAAVSRVRVEPQSRRLSETGNPGLDGLTAAVELAESLPMSIGALPGERGTTSTKRSETPSTGLRLIT